MKRRVDVGVDLHKGQFTVYWLREGEEKGKFERYLTDGEGYEVFEGKLKAAAEAGSEVRVAVETTGSARYFKNRIERQGIGVKVINTLKFKVVNESVKKTDRHDAARIAEFLAKDMLPEARLCSEESEALRRLVKSRKVLVRAVVSIKNQIHGLLLGFGIELAARTLQSKKNRRKILGVLEEQGLAGGAVEPLFETIDRLEEEVKKIERLIEERTKGDRTVELLKTIPGAGAITAATVRAFVDDIGRFEGYKHLCSYAGLAPWVQDSNRRERHGRITKRGPEELRTALVQIVVGMVRNKRRTGAYRIMERYAAMKPVKGSGKTIIATARKLAKVIFYMLKNNEPFDPGRMTDPDLKKAAREMSLAVVSVA